VLKTPAIHRKKYRLKASIKMTSHNKELMVIEFMFSPNPQLPKQFEVKFLNPFARACPVIIQFSREINLKYDTLCGVGEQKFKFFPLSVSSSRLDVVLPYKKKKKTVPIL
jgi:hypothetical protein